MHKESISGFSLRFRLGRKWTALVLCLCMLSPLLSACGSKASPPIAETNSTEPAVRVGSMEALLQYGLLTGKEENPFGISVSYVKPVQEGTLLLWTDGTSARISLVNAEKKTLRDASLPDTFLGEPKLISQADDGWVILSSAEDEFFHVQYYLTKVASDFSSAADTVCLNELTDSTVYGFECIGTTAVLSGDIGMFFYDISENITFGGKMKPKDPVFDLTVSGGKLYALQDKAKDKEELICDVLLSEVDISGFKLTNTKTIYTGAAYAERLFGDKEGFENTIACAFNDGFYLYATDGSSFKKGFSCYLYTGRDSEDTISNTSGHMIQTISEICRTGEGTYKAWGSYNTSTHEAGGQFVMMDIMPRDNLEKVSLKVGVLSFNSVPEIYNICDYMNTLNLPFSLDVTVYCDPSDPNFVIEDYTTGRLEFLRDAVSDNPPDLLILSPQEREMFAAQDALLDLTPYIDGSKDFEPSEMLPSAWSVLTAGGQCDWIPPYVYLEGTSLTEEAASELGDGDTENIRAYMAAHPEETVLSGGLTGTFQNLLLKKISDAMNAGEDNSEEKTAVVDLIRLMVEMKTRNAAKSGIQTAPACYGSCTVYGLSDYYYLLRRSPVPLMLQGDIGRLDKGPCIMATGGVAISAGSDQADLCWSAIEFMLSEEIMDLYGDGIPLRTSSFDTKILHDISGMTGINGEIVEHNFMTIDGGVEKQYDIKQDAALINNYRQVVQSADTFSYFNYDLFLMIDEELKPCFAGDLTPEDTADRLIGRVGLYLSEHENGSS